MNFDEKIVKKRAAARFPPTVSCRLALELKPKLYPNFPNMQSLFSPCWMGKAMQQKKLTHKSFTYSDNPILTPKLTD